MPNQSTHRSLSFLSCLAIAAIVPCELFAHGGGGDIAVFTSGGRAEVAFTVLDDDDIEQIEFDPSIRVFSSILLPQPPIPGLPDVGSSEPGYDANEGDLPANSLLTVSILSLDFWDGVGGVNFATASGVAPSYTPATANIAADGGFHAHPLFGLTDTTPDAMPIPNGVYLATLSLSVTGLNDSHPFHLVTLVDDLITNDADPEDAAETLGELIRVYLNDPLNAPAPIFGGKDFTFYANAIRSVQAVPEPSTVALLALIAIGCMFFRRVC